MSSHSLNPMSTFEVPFSVSILLSNALHPNTSSPAGTLIIPLIRILIPHGYFIIIGLELATAFFAKWSTIPTSIYGTLPGGYCQSLPDINAFRQVYSSPPVVPRQARNGLLSEIFQTPILPSKGMSVSVSLSAPFTSIQSRTTTLYAFELFNLKQIPGYAVPLASLILYIILALYQKPEKSVEKH